MAVDFGVFENRIVMQATYPSAMSETNATSIATVQSQRCVKGGGMKGDLILTAIDESVVVLGKSLVSISFALELHSCNTLGTSVGVEMKSDFFQRTNC